MIAFSGEYAIAGRRMLPPPPPPQECIPSPTNPCNGDISFPTPDPGHQGAIITRILERYQQAIQDLEKEDPHTIQKIRKGDLATLQKLEQLAPGSRLKLQPYLNN